jgi:Xaa-Pro aminopeptidase
VLNRNYLTGVFLTETERPNYLFVPAQGEPAAFIPGLDRDMMASWWIKDYEWYFDFPHAGEFNKVQWKAGKKAELFEWALGGIARRGFAKAKLGIDLEPTPSLAKRFKKALPRARLADISKDLLHMRQVKTPEEIALTQQAIDLQDRMLAFARNYILERGTDATDFDVRHATEDYGTHELMKVLKLDGRPHTGVGIRLGFGCRAGVATAYPHPNQFFYKRIERGDAVQIATLINIGGYGGEGYRALHIAPMTDEQKRLWEVHTRMTLTQAELTRAGTRCQEVAEKVLKIALDAGLEKYVYHRPAHGAGMEGHQAPYLALGDDTVIEENMMFSNEPGLYNSEGGYGYNHSNNVLATKERGVIMNKTPLTKEWCWLNL